MKFKFIESRGTWGTWGETYVIESKSTTSSTGYSSISWLVVKNKTTGKYVTDDDGNAYKKFKNSDEIRKYFETHEGKIREDKDVFLF